MEPRRTRARAARHLDPAGAAAQPPDHRQDGRLSAALLGVGETSAERLLPFLRRREAGQRLGGAACRLFQRLVRLVVIDIEATGLGRVPRRLREHLDAVVLGIAEIDRPGVGVRHRLGLGVRQLPHLLIDATHLVEAVDADRDMPDAAPRRLRIARNQHYLVVFYWAVAVVYHIAYFYRSRI